MSENTMITEEEAVKLEAELAKSIYDWTPVMVAAKFEEDGKWVVKVFPTPMWALCKKLRLIDEPIFAMWSSREDQTDVILTVPCEDEAAADDLLLSCGSEWAEAGDGLKPEHRAAKAAEEATKGSAIAADTDDE